MRFGDVQDTSETDVNHAPISACFYAAQYRDVRNRISED